ncbi:uncharacterized protein BJ212DRAFT_1294947 [Suillus subaureus]|uniref:NAD(+) ADP-ribosyltransferase n=1 Tax=Suillus subaureus TaxID=48587 RepID=A0A9P7ELZ9_9AGAM|nr:uncharacterized protein BJ212DRAFT_1294947 [Suillus subaureus]KAG1825528.1 hypothetical protein BJ212DRAFT_1294947 [Suillus subaureus]
MPTQEHVTCDSKTMTLVTIRCSFLNFQVTVVKQGAAPVDPMSGPINTHQVYLSAESVWDAMLNQTEVGSNKNKFYVIQLLHPIGNDTQSSLYMCWDCVGENGASQIKFKKQFRLKSGVAWPQHFGMVAGKGK